MEKPASSVSKRHNCPYCDEIYISLHFLQTHLFYCHKAISHICSICKKGFLNQDDYTAHMSKCHQYKPLKSHLVEKHNCPHCDEIFTTRLYLERHLVGGHKAICHICSNCQKGFLNQYDYVAHMDKCQMKPLKIHSTEKTPSPVFEKHTCPHCVKVFVTLHYLENHLFIVHKAISPICSSCKKGFLNQDDYTAHMDKCQKKPLKIHSTEKTASPVSKRHNCPHCDKIFSTLHYLQTHLFIVHKAISPICSSCKKGFLNQDDYVVHMDKCQMKPLKIHLMEKPESSVSHNCPYCDKIYISLHYLQIHLFYNHKTISHICSSCKKRFLNQDDYTAHMNKCQCKPLNTFSMEKAGSSVSKRHTCPYCEKIYGSLHYLENHLFYNHKAISHICRSCKKGFLNQDDYLTHMDKCEKEPLKTRSMEKPASPVFNRHTCPHCVKVFVTLHYLENHLFNVHRAISPICSSCQKGFLNQDDCMAHIDKCPKESLMTHSMEQTASSVFEKHNCPHCDQIFTTLHYLQNHLFYGHKVISHICSHCRKGFLNQDDYTAHMNKCQPLKIRSMEKPASAVSKRHTCPHCDMIFTTLHYLQTHLFNSHRARSYVCRSCQKGFLHQVARKAHTDKCHSSENKLKRYHHIQFECLCCTKFHKLTDLEEHIVSCHKSEISCLCFYCGQRFTDIKSRQRHECPKREEKQHLCPLCRKGFNDLHNLKGHLDVHKGERPHVCPHCNKHYRELSELEAHVHVHMNIGMSRLTICSKCNIMFADTCFLGRDVSRVNLVSCDIENSECQPSSLCSACGSESGSFSMQNRSHPILESHSSKSFERVKDGTSHYGNVCPYCTNSFPYNEHLYTDTGEKECAHCGLSFLTGTELKHHMYNHTGDLPYTCPHCGKGCLYRSTLEDHMMKHNREKQIIPSSRLDSDRLPGTLSSDMMKQKPRSQLPVTQKTSEGPSTEPGRVVGVTKVCSESGPIETFLSTKLKQENDLCASSNEQMETSCTLSNKRSYCQCEPYPDEPTAPQTKIHKRDTVHSRCNVCVRGFMKENDLVSHLASHR